MESFFKNIKEYWFIIIFIGMVVVSWTTFTARLSNLEDRVKAMESAILSFDQVRIDIAVIKNDIGAIKERIK